MIKEFGHGIKIIVSEMDGVLTDGKFAVDEMGNSFFKVYNAKDFAAINVLRKHCTIVFLCDDNRINYNKCQRKNLPFFWGKNEDGKYKMLGDILRRYGFSAEEAIYIGSKPTDKKCLQMVPSSICPADASDYVKSFCRYTFVSSGGDGVFVDLLDSLTENIKILEKPVDFD